jgi:hypothetical protein
MKSRPYRKYSCKIYYFKESRIRLDVSILFMEVSVLFIRLPALVSAMRVLSCMIVVESVTVSLVSFPLLQAIKGASNTIANNFFM